MGRSWATVVCEEPKHRIATDKVIVRGRGGEGAEVCVRISGVSRHNCVVEVHCALTAVDSATLSTKAPEELIDCRVERDRTVIDRQCTRILNPASDTLRGIVGYRAVVDCQ